jgi:transposase-like protein
MGMVMTSTPTTPTESFGLDSEETTYVEFVEPSCPNCGSTAVTKDGTYTRYPHGRAPVRIQRYDCPCCPGTFSASLPSVEDGHRYADAVPKLVRTVTTFASVTLYRLQDICIVQFGVCPSVQQIQYLTMLLG